MTALDFNEEFVKRTRERVHNKAEVLQANLAEHLTFARDTFDLIVCPLVMHYLKDWQPTFKEFYRVLKPNGILVFLRIILLEIGSSSKQKAILPPNY